MKLALCLFDSVVKSASTSSTSQDAQLSKFNKACRRERLTKMGKKSRKKGAGKAANKSKKSNSRSNQQGQGGERQDQRDRNQTPDYYNRDQREYSIGDRVWMIRNASHENANTVRGIIVDIFDDYVQVNTLQQFLDGEEDEGVLNSPKSLKFPDFQDFTLRFDVGERIVFRLISGSHDLWCTGNVMELWPIRYFCSSREYPCDASYDRQVPRYCLKVDFHHSGMGGQWFMTSIDDDTALKLRPSSFRFKVGDEVDINPKKAYARTNKAEAALAQSATTLKGKITAVDVSKVDVDYAVYECSFGEGLSCRILDDTDDHVSKVGANPRERLFDAIEQNCSSDHLQFLRCHFSVDVLAFSDLVVAKSIESGSLQALSWLQKKCNIDVVTIKDERGNNFLHQMAQSGHITRFIREVGMACCDGEMEPILDLIRSCDEEPLHSELNNDGETWIQVLVKRRDVKALDAALSTHCGFAWDLCGPEGLPTDVIDSLAKSVRESGDPMMKCIFDSFVSFRKIYEQFWKLNFCLVKTEEEVLSSEELAVYREINETAKKSAEVLTQFCRDWCDHPSNRVARIRHQCGDEIILNGCFRLFQLFYENELEWFRYDTYKVKSKEDRSEYIQRQLCDYQWWKYDDNDENIFTACIVGSDEFYRLQRRDKWEYRKITEYLENIKQYATTYEKNECPSLHHHLQKFIDEIKSSKMDEYDYPMFLKRIALLKDDDNTEGRRQILDYLLEKESNATPDILQPLKHRQYWALRFMVEKGLVRLNMPAKRSNSFKNVARDLCFLEDYKLEGITEKCCLCFAAVQYDDLQSLEYLCEFDGTPVEMVGGWNLLHFSAYMGRIEIIAWLHYHAAWDSLVAQACQREEFKGTLAVHIAASQGHLDACDLMIELGVPLEDMMGHSPEFYAISSPHEYVVEWAEERRTPQTLKADIKKLSEIVLDFYIGVEEIKYFIENSTCLDVDVWIECGYSSYDKKGPTDRSFGDVLHECCRHVDMEIIEWICMRLYFCDMDSHDHDKFWKSSELMRVEPDARERSMFDTLKHISNDLLGFQGQEHEMRANLTQDDLIQFLTVQGYDHESSLLRQKWFKSVSCADPLTHGILNAALNEDKRLVSVRNMILRVHVLLAMAKVCREEFLSLLNGGERVDELRALKTTQSIVIESLFRFNLSRIICTPSNYDNSFFEQPGMDIKLYSIDYDEEHPVRKQWKYLHASPNDMTMVHIFLATEGYSKLAVFCLENLRGWTADIELDMVRISSYFGHAEILELFLNGKNLCLQSSDREIDMYDEAIFGAGEALRYQDLQNLVDRFGARLDSLKGFDDIAKMLENSSTNDLCRIFSKSLIMCVMNGYFLRAEVNHDADNKTSLLTLGVLVDKLGYSIDDVLLALELMTKVLRGVEEMRNLIDMTRCVIEGMGLKPILHSKRFRSLCKAVAHQAVRLSRARGEESFENYVSKWLGDMADAGIVVQDLMHGSIHTIENSVFMKAFRVLEREQKRKWSTFAVIKNGAPLEDIRLTIARGELRVDARDKGGLLLTHLSAAYDRDDVLEWLVNAKDMKLAATDGEGRTVQDVAEAAKASKALKWIAEWNARNTIASFLRRNYYRILQMRRLRRLNIAATIIQRFIRGYSTRKLYSGALSHRLEESKRFNAIWGHVLGFISSSSSMDWSSIREKQLDIKVGIDDELFDETDRRLMEAVDVAVSEDMEFGEECIKADDHVNLEGLTINDDNSSAMIEDADTNEWLSFQMTSHVVKFLQQGDRKYRSFFVRRMQQLARGERSRILRKALKGCQSHIYETYLEQKSGHRILWTEEGDGIVVWYVAKHKQVNRLMQLIDDSKSRSARQQMPQTLSDELRKEGAAPTAKSKKEVLLDIIGNAPLKVYDVNFNAIDEIDKDSWTPQLHLTEEEREIVEANGTVLVLGRSGTGKTVCICNRIECDRQSRAVSDPSFTQLFVARSSRLCKYVEGAVGEDNRTSFCTYSTLLSDIEISMSQEQKRRSFNPSHKMNFQRFKQEFHNSSNMKVSALILWTVIRTFLKGSIESFQSLEGYISGDDFVKVEKLGKNRCRIPQELRGYIYEEFLRYEDYLKERKLWDDCDRVRHLMLRIKESKEAGSDAFGQVQKSRVYVDEVQDYTQLEILLFFYLCGPNGLFLAGDPAQSVVEGTEFRFEEVRSVGHFVGSIIQKPKTVNVNFRSHSGILNCAGGVLDLMFEHFPSSAKQLKKDEGLFQGSRPGIISGASIDQLNVLLSDKLKGAVVLTHDDSASHWRRRLNDYKVSENYSDICCFSSPDSLTAHICSYQ